MLLEWWNDIVRWATSNQGSAILTEMVLPFAAILAAGIIAALIARGAIKKLLAQQERDHKTAAVAGLITAGRKAARWSSLSAPEQDHVEHQFAEAEVRVRLLPVAGADLAADWASHHLATMKRNSVNFSFQADHDLGALEDGLVAWHRNPRRAKKLFAADLASWKYDDGAGEDALIAKQREWAAAQEATTTDPLSTPASATTPLASQTPVGADYR